VQELRSANGQEKLKMRKPKKLEINSALSLAPGVFDIGKVVMVWTNDELSLMTHSDVKKLREWVEKAEAWMTK